jgi:hypothetical protein
LIKIVALSWRHGDQTGPPLLNVTRLDGTVQRGLAVAFGLSSTLLRPVIVGPQSLDTHTMEAFILEPLATGIQPQVYAKLPGRVGDVIVTDVIPIKVGAIAGGAQITSASEVPRDTNGTAKADGAALVFVSLDPGRIKARELYVQIRGDLVIDANSRAVDGNFLGGQLPTGDGVAGGTFWSWFRMP